MVSEALFRAIELGEFERVKALVESVKGTGIFPPRLTLLSDTNAAGQRPEDFAEQLAHRDPKYRLIAEYLSSQRLHMEYFE